MHLQLESFVLECELGRAILLGQSVYVQSQWPKMGSNLFREINVSVFLVCFCCSVLEIGHFIDEGALRNSNEYKDSATRIEEAFGRNGISVIHPDRQTDRQAFTG